MVYFDLKNTIQTGGNPNTFLGSMKHILSDKYEIFLIFFNIIIFMVIQTLFFYFVVSKEYDTLLEEKMTSIKYFISHDEEYKKQYDELKNNYLKNYGKKAEDQEKERKETNNTLYWYYCYIPILLIFLLFIVYIVWFYFSHPDKKLSCIQSRNLFLVVFVYAPEILLFFFVIKKYQYIGNIEILSKIYKNLNKEN